VRPHSAVRGQTPDERYFGTGDTVPADRTSRAAAARRRRVDAIRSAPCETCPSVGAAASPCSADRRSDHGHPRAVRLAAKPEAPGTAHRHEPMGRTVSRITVAARQQLLAA
jgi:hypothetical protein